jgi:hypothetical protein
MDATTVAVDLAKDIFEVALANRAGRVIERKRLTRRLLMNPSNGSTRSGARAAKPQDGSRRWPSCRKTCRGGHKKSHKLIESFVGVRLERA